MHLSQIFLRTAHIRANLVNPFTANAYKKNLKQKAFIRSGTDFELELKTSHQNLEEMRNFQGCVKRVYKWNFVYIIFNRLSVI